MSRKWNTHRDLREEKCRRHVNRDNFLLMFPVLLSCSFCGQSKPLNSNRILPSILPFFTTMLSAFRMLTYKKGPQDGSTPSHLTRDLLLTRMSPLMSSRSFYLNNGNSLRTTDGFLADAASWSQNLFYCTRNQKDSGNDSHLEKCLYMFNVQRESCSCGHQELTASAKVIELREAELSERKREGSGGRLILRKRESSLKIFDSWVSD